MNATTGMFTCIVVYNEFELHLKISSIKCYTNTLAATYVAVLL